MNTLYVLQRRPEAQDSEDSEDSQDSVARRGTGQSEETLEKDRGHPKKPLEDPAVQDELCGSALERTGAILINP
jgi:hypothetical protein